MTRVAAVVVLYEPDFAELTRNIKTYAGADRIYLTDNSGHDHSAEAATLPEQGLTVEYIYNNGNKGIGFALNIAAAKALDAGFEWLLTMDQDSSFRDGQFELYRKSMALFDDTTSIALVGIRQENAADANTAKAELVPAASLITSGSLVRLSAWKEAGGFEEKLFIDEVDHEYCYRLLEKGKEVMLFTGVTLVHQLGKTMLRSFLGLFRKYRTIHHPRRLYFIVRNYCYVRKKYKGLLAAEFKKRDGMLLRLVKNNLFFSGNFFSVLANMYKGYRDYRRNDFSATL